MNLEITQYGPYSRELRLFVAKAVQQEVAVHPRQYTCTFVEATFGTKALQWYQKELWEYVRLMYPNGMAYTSIPFTEIARDWNLKDSSVARIVFVNQLVNKYA